MLNGRRKLTTLPMAVAFASVLLVGCGETTPVQEAEEEGGPAQAAILNETVTFQNEVTEIHGPHLFTVGAEDTPVIDFDAAAAEIEEGDLVQVTGTVRQVVMTEVESDWGIDFDDDETSYLVEHEFDLAVVADDVQELPQQ